jgi:hypothetical protein
VAKRRTGRTLIQQSRGTSAQQKALYHQVLGAGKARVKREFLGLTVTDQADIISALDKGIRKRLARAT